MTSRSADGLLAELADRQHGAVSHAQLIGALGHPASGPDANRRDRSRESGAAQGTRAHQAGLAADEITEVDGIPVTTVARTLLDLAAVPDSHDVERAIEQAEALRLFVVELDSWRHHATKVAFRRDRPRDRRLQPAGWVPVRVTSWDIEEEPDRLVAELAGLLSVARAGPHRPAEAA
jgi:hypothetical protein